MNQALTFDHRIFDVETIDDAKRIILTDEDSSTEHRWTTETPYLADLISRCFTLSAKSLVLDYGCGIGRVSKALIARHGCNVVGVDISPSMRSMAVSYVESDRFAAWSPQELDEKLGIGVAFDLAISVWVLQHCPDVHEDVSRIARALAPSGGLFVVNQRTRCVPTVEAGWYDDGIDVFALLKTMFHQRSRGSMPAKHTSKALSLRSSWAAFRRL